MDEKKPDAQPIRKVTQALKPPTGLRGGGLGLGTSRYERPTRVPPGWPSYYPNVLKPQTDVIINEAVREFPVQTHAAQLCRRVFSELTPHIGQAIRQGELKAHEVKGHMEALLHSLVVYNSNYERDGYDLENDVRGSDEWLNLSREVMRTAVDQPPDVLAKPQSWEDASTAKATSLDPAKTPVNERRSLITKKIQDNPKGCVTIKEAGIYFDVAPKTIRAWVKGEVQTKRLTSGVKRGTITNESIQQLEKRSNQE